MQNYISFILKDSTRNEIKIQYENRNEIMGSIFQKYCTKTGANIDSICFQFNGKIISSPQTISELIEQNYSKDSQLSFYVLEKPNQNINVNNINNNEASQINNNEINSLSNFNYEKIKNILNSETKCAGHNDGFICYCKTCKKDLCLFCKNAHEGHEIENLIDLVRKPEDNNNFIEKKDLEKILTSNIPNIINYLEQINKIIYSLSEYARKIELNYKINKELVNKYNFHKRNYNIWQSIRKIYEKKTIFDDLNEITKDIDNTCFLFNMYNSNLEEEVNNNNNYRDGLTQLEKMISEKYNKFKNFIEEKRNENLITIEYEFNKFDEKIKLFGKTFIENNIDKCKMIIDGREKSIEEWLTIPDNAKNEGKIAIKLKNYDRIENGEHMFSECKSLSNLCDISKLDTFKIHSMSHMFYGCSKLLKLPDIGCWKTDNVSNMSFMFYGCSSLLKLPDISCWKTDNVKDMKQMFSGCYLLTELPENISQWKTHNVKDMQYMFYNCKALESLPDISRWNVEKVKDFSYFLSGCSSLTKLPDLTNWKIDNAKTMKSMFENCNSLEAIPNIPINKADKLNDISKMFYGCNSLKGSVNIDKWNLNRIKYRAGIFGKCFGLTKYEEVKKI